MIGRVKFGRFALAVMAGTTCLYGGASFAQANDPAGKQADAAPAKIEEVVVTGSRVRRSNLTEPTPLTVLNADQIRFSGFTSLGQVLNQLTQVSPSTNNQNTGLTLFATGSQTVDIRGLGAARTLVLVNGKRHQAGIFTSSAVDLNGFATNYIEKTEVITGGASAAYGSEAISGVVNLITRKDLEGIELNTTGGISDKGDGSSWNIGLTAGHRYLNDRAYSIVAVEMVREDPILQKNRDWAYPLPVYNANVIPQVLIPGQTITSVSPTGVFRGLGVAISLDRKSVNKIPATCVAGQVACFDTTDFKYGADYNYLSSKIRRTVVNTYNEYKFTDHIKGTLEAEYSGVDGVDPVGQPGFNTAQKISRDNGFLAGSDPLATALRGAFDAAGLTKAAQSTTAGFFFDDIGQRVNSQRRWGNRVAVGLEGDFDVLARNVKWDGYYTYGQERGTTYGYGGYITANLTNAFDSIVDPATGSVVCRSVTARAAGCVPYDFIHGPSKQAINYVSAINTVYGKLNQNVAAVNFNTDIVQLPAGPLGLAIGAEYRNEYLNQDFDPLTKAGLLFTNQRNQVTGQFNVKEAYAEAVIPLLKDLPFVKYLGAEVAGRSAEYSSAGFAKSYKIGGEYAPTEDLRIRSTSSRALRAPNLFELYSPLADNFTTIQDPCDFRQIKIAPNPALRTANCLAIMRPGLPSYDPNTYISGNSLSSTHLLQGGNPALKPEQGVTFTAGAVATPRWIPNFSLSADYFTYTVLGAINTLGATATYQFCYDLSNTPLTNPYCQLITRDFTGTSPFVNNIPGSISAVKLVNLNLAKFITKGVDYEANYRFELGGLLDLAKLNVSDPGDIAINVKATNIQSSQTQGNPTLPITTNENTLGQPRWKVRGTLTWSNDKWSFSWNTLFISDAPVNNTLLASQITPYFYKKYLLHGINTSYAATSFATVRLGVTNLFDRNPPITVSGTSTAGSQYDNRGRYIFGGVTLKY